MDLQDVVAPLPDANAVKRLIAFCVDELHLATCEITPTLRRAYHVARAVGTLSAEATRETDAQRRRDEWDATIAGYAEILAGLSARDR